MGTPFMGEVKLVSFNFAPQGWAQCNGQFLPINQNQALFSLLGTTYGGDGRTTFALPDLRGRVPIHMGGGHVEGEAGGQSAHTVIQSELPAHNHFVRAASSATGGNASPNGRYLGGANNAYHAATSLTSLNPAIIVPVGGSQPHENRQPYLVLLFCIALAGVFPSRN